MSDYQVPEKKGKFEENASGDDKNGVNAKHTQPFENFEVVRTLNESSQRKMTCVLGKFKNREGNAVVILEKTPFSEDNVKRMLSVNTDAELNLQNDIYGTHQLFPAVTLNAIKSTLIYPATEKHVAKYSAQEMCLVEESAEAYTDITLPHLLAENFSIQWVYNILEKKSEADRIVFEDPHPETGFILLPDMKWDRKQVEDLYLVAIIHKRDLKSLRDLTQEHLPLLKNILESGKAAIKDKYDLPSSKLRIYLHYQPSYYHLHVHFTHLKYDAPGSGVEKAHLLTDVIDNIELMGDYYQKKSLSFMVKVNDGLYKKYKDSGKL